MLLTPFKVIVRTIEIVLSPARKKQIASMMDIDTLPPLSILIKILDIDCMRLQNLHSSSCCLVVNVDRKH